MKLPEFDYARPTSLSDAIHLLADSDAKLLAGGQSLMPMMAYRLATPSLLVDIGDIPGLTDIDIGASGVCLGARVRWCDIEGDARLVRAHPLLRDGVGYIAHYQIRNRGTVGGSLAHADPAAELPAIVLACDASIVVVGVDGERVIAIDAFLLGPLTTALDTTDIITAIRLPAWPLARRCAFAEMSRRRGDFALAGVCLWFDLDEDGCVAEIRIVGFGATEMPIRMVAAEDFLRRRQPDASACAQAAKIAGEGIEPVGDIHASPAYRRSLFTTLVERALLQAASRPSEVGR